MSKLKQPAAVDFSIFRAGRERVGVPGLHIAQLGHGERLRRVRHLLPRQAQLQAPLAKNKHLGFAFGCPAGEGFSGGSQSVSACALRHSLGEETLAIDVCFGAMQAPRGGVGVLGPAHLARYGIGPETLYRCWLRL